MKGSKYIKEEENCKQKHNMVALKGVVPLVCRVWHTNNKIQTCKVVV
jgi:hypothetical protein